MILLFKYTACR